MVKWVPAERLYLAPRGYCIIAPDVGSRFY